MRRTILTALAAILAFVPAALADESDSKPPVKKVDKEVKVDKAEIDALISKLGDASYKVRKTATERLLAIGKPALPALRKATSSDDMEISRRAELIVNKMTAVDQPKKESNEQGGAEGLNRWRIPAGPGGAQQFRVQIVQMGGPGKNTAFTEDDNSQILKISEGKKSQTFTRTKATGAFSVEVTEAGKTKTHKFKDEAAFKTGQPALHKVWTDGKKGNNRLQVMIGGMPGAGGPGQKQLQKLFKRMGVAPPKAGKRGSTDPLGGPSGVKHGMLASQPSPALLKHLNLSAGVLVYKVTGGLASKLGLEQWDLVTGVDGKAVATADALNVALQAGLKAGKVNVTFFRGGKKQDKELELKAEDK